MNDVTKDGIRVEVGQCWQDLDKRMKNRVRQVAEVKDGRARMRHPTLTQMPHTWVSVRRMHRHSTGWVLASARTSGAVTK